MAEKVKKLKEGMVLVRVLRAFVMPELDRPAAPNLEMQLPEERALGLAEAGLIDILTEPAK